MKTQTHIHPNEPTIIMTRVYDAAQERVWEAITEAKHVRRWWGGLGFSNPVCEMDVRPGGLWTHVMRFPDATELRLEFVFLEVERPSRLVWQHTDYGKRNQGLPACQMTVTLEDLAGQTRWTMVARFQSLEQRDVAVGFGFNNPIAASSDYLADYLKTI